MSLPKQILYVESLGHDMTSASVISEQAYISEFKNISIQASWSGSTPTGTIVLQASNDGINFGTIVSSSQNVTGNSGTLIFKDSEVGYQYFRALYTKSGGTGTLNFILNGRQ